MTFVVGYRPHKDDEGPLELACQLARAYGSPVEALTVVPQGWPTAVAGDTDREFRRWAVEEGQACAVEALERLAAHPDVEATASWVSARSVPQALLDRVDAVDAGLVVVGSGEEVATGQVAVTSKTDRLLHSSPVPVAIAPRGYRAGEAATVTRATVAFRGDDTTWNLLDRVAGMVRETQSSIRVVTFAIRRGGMYTSGVPRAEDPVLRSWVARAEEEQARARDHLTEQGFTDDEVECLTVVAGSWGGAMDRLDWGRGDLLVLGSSSSHRLAQVFLGSSAAKILRHSPVPVIVVPGLTAV